MDEDNTTGWLSVAHPPKSLQRSTVIRHHGPLSRSAPPRSMRWKQPRKPLSLYLTQNSPPPPQLLTAVKQSSLMDYFGPTEVSGSSEDSKSCGAASSSHTHKGVRNKSAENNSPVKLCQPHTTKDSMDHVDKKKCMVPVSCEHPSLCYSLKGSDSDMSECTLPLGQFAVMSNKLEEHSGICCDMPKCHCRKENRGSPGSKRKHYSFSTLDQSPDQSADVEKVVEKCFQCGPSDVESKEKHVKKHKRLKTSNEQLYEFLNSADKVSANPCPEDSISFSECLKGTNDMQNFDSWPALARSYCSSTQSNSVGHNFTDSEDEVALINAKSFQRRTDNTFDPMHMKTERTLCGSPDNGNRVKCNNVVSNILSLKKQKPSNSGQILLNTGSRSSSISSVTSAISDNVTASSSPDWELGTTNTAEVYGVARHYQGPGLENSTLSLTEDSLTFTEELSRRPSVFTQLNLKKSEQFRERKEKYLQDMGTLTFAESESQK